MREDITEAAITAEAAWLDPARRRDSRRVSDPEDYAPPLSWLTDLSAQGVGSIGVKLSPGIEHSLAGRFGAELEFLSEGGECREALLWLGGARSGDAAPGDRAYSAGAASAWRAEEDAPGQPSAVRTMGRLPV